MTIAALRNLTRQPLLALGLLVASAGSLLAQGIVSGRITDRADGRALVGARVLVIGTSLLTTTNAEGRYRIPNVPAGAQQVRASQIGYASATQSVAVTDQATVTADITLTLTPFSLDEVVVTATGDQAKKELGNVVSTVDATNLVQTAPITNMNDLLVAKVPGVTVLPGSTTGTGGRVRIRGNSSLSLSNNPIYIIDGVRMVGDVNSSSIGIGGSLPSRVNDLNPEDIESIDVVHGPSASTLYGTDAANGVIVIKTKRGKAGRAAWTAYAEQGFIRDENTYPSNWRAWCTRTSSTPGCSATSTNLNSGTAQCFLSGVVTTNVAVRCTQDSVSSFNIWKDPDSSPLGVGNRNQVGVQVSGGSDAVRYYLSTEWERELGVLQMPRAFGQRILAARAINSVPGDQQNPNYLRRVNLRANIFANLNDKMDVSFNTGYVSSGLRLPQIDNNANGIGSNGFGGPGFKNFLTTTHGGVLINNLGWRSATPDEIFSIVYNQGINRTISSGTFNYRPTSWLSARVTAGLDFIMRQDTELCRRDQCPFLGTQRTGFKEHNRTTFFDYTGDASATASYKLAPQLAAKSTAGVQYIKENNTRNLAFAENLGPGSTTVSSGSIPSAGEATTTAITLGYFAEQRLSWKDRVFVTGAVRSDRNSAFGNRYSRVYYPKISVSYVLSDEPFFPKTRFLSSFRVRGAFGASGRQPGANDAILFFTPTTTNVDGADTPGLVLSALGNPNLKPERSQELETGFDASFGNNRVNFEFTFYNKSSRDALISRIVAPSVGAAASRFENIGEVRNRGIEASLNAIVAESKSFSWDFTVSGSYNRNLIVSLGGTPPSRGTTTSDIEGYPIQGWWLRPFTYKDVNGDGIIQGDTALAVRELFVGDTAVYKGPSLPPAELSAFNTISLFGRKLLIQSLVDAKLGGYQLNGTERIRCDTRFNCRGDIDPTAPLSEQARAIAVRVHPSKTQWGYVEKTNLLRLRELSLTYTLPDRWAHYFSANQISVTAAGRNLGIITGYSGVDPEGGYFGDNIGVQSDFQTPPPPTYYTFRVNVRF
ncbi:MAG TPA: SusC/RagA family TonB-linked outer membrane protein [Gemmatimonadales bacterium]|jgi:TonB-linked SusC/RagA family outer membrane protein|nr:SusC/RagA family TonB-linked outer membrane protein [Gemmatimonadales bacterium]